MQLRPVAGRIDVDAVLVRQLVAGQFTHWAHLPVQPVRESGWDNHSFRLGSDMLVRIPSGSHYSAQVPKEQRWLPALAPHLPLAIPNPLALGKPSGVIAWPWSVYRWLEGEPAHHRRIPDLPAFAAQLARFLNALRHADTNGAPAPGLHSFHRGGDPTVYDGETRAAVAALGHAINGSAVLQAWEAALETQWRESPVWVHGDIAPGNLLVRDGDLSAVIDFGNCAVGDPACDLAITWTFFDQPARRSLKMGTDVDAGTWARAAGWALWKALIVLARDPTSASEASSAARQTINAVIADPMH